MFVLTSGQILLGQLFQFSGRIPRALVARYFLSTRTITSRWGNGSFQILGKKFLDQRSCEGAREHSPHICTVVWFRVSSESARNEVRIRETHVIGPGHHHIVGIGVAADVLTRSALTRSVLLGRKKQKRLVHWNGANIGVHAGISRTVQVDAR